MTEMSTLSFLLEPSDRLLYFNSRCANFLRGIAGVEIRRGVRESRKNSMTNRVLIVGTNVQRASLLLKRLYTWDCDVYFTERCAEALPLLRQDRFGLVLSQLFLPDGTADRFLKPLSGIPTHMFFSNFLEDDAWWLHVLDRGENRWWKPSLIRPEEFLFLVERLLRGENVDTRRSERSGRFRDANSTSRIPCGDSFG